MMAVNFDVLPVSRQTMFKLSLLFLSCLIYGESAKLSVPRILLPYNTGVPTNYSLEVKEGGCYKWSSSRYDLVSVTPIHNEGEPFFCSTKALVSAVSRYPDRDSAIILAEDEKSGQLLRCDVVIDALHTIEIVTTTRVLFLEDAPEAFEVIAKNDQSDTFSSLAGVAFQWSLESDSLENDVYGVLRFLKFSDSAYKTPPTIDFWEKQNLHGSMVLMEGAKTGSAKVTVKPLDSAYKHVPPYDVSLVVVANLNLKPSHVYLLPGSKIEYQLELIKQGKAFPKSLPSDQYYLEVVNKSIAQLKDQTPVVTALKYGVTNVAVKDKYITGKEVAYLPSGVIHVTPPSYLTLSVHPGEKWSLEEGKFYYVTVNLYDRNSHPIHLTEDVRVSVQFPSNFFQAKSLMLNGTYHEIKALMPGSCLVTAQLLGVADEDGLIRKIEPSVSGSQDVVIYESIRVIPSETLLPWDPLAKPVYSIFLKATGGTGSFKWKSGDNNLATVQSVYHDDEPVAKVTTFGVGSLFIHAIDAHLPTFTGFGKVSVERIIDMKLLPDKVEVELNGSLSLPVAMYGYSPDKVVQLFTNCSSVPLAVEIDEIQKFIQDADVNLPVKSTACRNIVLKCVSKGFNRIRVKYEREDVSLKKAVIMACYKKLRVVYPSHEAVIAVGSSLNINFEGGPRPWPTCFSHYVDVINDFDFADVFVMKNESDVSDAHRVYAFCKGYGEEVYKLRVGNLPCDSNKNPEINEAQVKISCAEPESIVLKPILPTLPGKCPISGDNSVAVHSAQDIEIEVIVKDKLGRAFHNISSFDIRWYLSDTKLAYFTSNQGTKMRSFRLKDSQSKTRYYQDLHPLGPEGILKVSASILGYSTTFLQEENFLMDTYISPINSTLNLLLVEKAEIEPKRASVFNSPSNKVHLNITKGSGHFLIETSPSNKANVIYKSSSRQIEITPLETGTITISVTDLCLGISHGSVAEIQIYGISAVVVNVIDKVQLGKSIIATVEVLNEDMQRIPASVFSLMNLQPAISSDIVSVRLAAQPDPHQYQALYKISGLSLGVTNFKVGTRASVFKEQYASETYPIQVFSPLKVDPDRIVLIVGATFQVLCSGGPSPQVNIEFIIDNKDIATVTEAGIVEAKKVGETTLIAKSYGQDKKGDTVVFSEDKIIVTCVLLKEVKIHAPISRIVAGSEMPIYVTGLTEQLNPFAFGNAVPPAYFKWTVSNDKVASIFNMYNPVGLQESAENNFRVNLHAHQDGLVTVHVEVTIPKEKSPSFFGGPQVLTSEIQIQVFKRLRLTNPEVEDGMILLSPNSQLKLNCNRFGAAKITYQLSPIEHKSAQTPIVKVDDAGNLVASSKTGSATLLVTAVEEFGVVQRLTVVVKVEEKAYMMLKPTGMIRTKDWHLKVLPVGFVIPFKVTYHNSIGQVFDAVSSELQYRSSRLNSARVSLGTTNNSLSIQIVKPGFTVLKVWDSRSSIPPDYIKLVTGSAIDPNDVHLTVGDVVCFGSPLVTKEGHSGTWSSSKNVLAIHPTSGGAVALNPGQATIVYSLVNGFSTSTQVTIQEAAHIEIESGSVAVLSNLPRSKPYKIPVLVQSSNSRRTNNILGENCTSATEHSMPLPLVQPPFTCELNFVSSSMDVSVNDLFHTSSGFDIEKGTYYCSIDPLIGNPINEYSTLEGQLSLTAYLVSLDHISSLSQQLLLPFFPAFHVQQEELVLSDVQSSNHIVISAVPAVQRCIQVAPSDPSALKIKPAPLNLMYPATVSFLVELHDLNILWKIDASSLHIEISCPVTKQLVKVPIRIKRLEVPLDGSGYCLPSPVSPTSEVWYEWYFIMKIALAVLVIFIISYVFRWLSSARKGMVTTQPVFLNRSHNGSHSLSPGRVSPQFTPSPFRQRYSPPEENLENITHPLRLCTLDTSPSRLRRQSDNVFR